MGFAGCGLTEAKRMKLFCFFFLEKRSACWLAAGVTGN
jgi:hypothetical protein